MAHPLLGYARQVLETHLGGGDWSAVMRALPPEPPRGCFVSLKIAWRLRGCIGTVLPVRTTLAEEVAENAIAAATRDPRFGPLRPDELPSVRVSLDLLTVPEPARGPADLDAARFGVVLRGSDTLADKVGVLLPDIPGVHSPRQQIEICLEKAGLPPTAEYTLQRFRVERIAE